ncbi:hypothetical protein PV08_06457 [Exophiala spinifera]|uniref:Uncharacterized protein n=1 Tax=Exophiala spinifera TaxID=91928 RepID=A0A0D2BCR0_9EURO|nr:uncharacterized protein PV08_06457 [Exophiala spinifera]KIW16405.1 hypothetical protein PV08_06457 [Exophiala spinifera]
MPPKGASTAVNPIRLQTVSRIKIRHPDKAEPNPCLGPMSAMLTLIPMTKINAMSSSLTGWECTVAKG